MQILLGLVHATPGTATVLGRAPADAEVCCGWVRWLRSRRSIPTFPGATTSGVARLAGLREHRIDAALAEVDLDDRATDRFKTFTGHATASGCGVVTP